MVNFNNFKGTERIHKVYLFVQVGVKHIVLAVSYRAEMLEQEMKAEADKVSLIETLH